MAKKNPKVAVWLLDDWARRIVGAKPADEDSPPSRWAVQGVIVEEVSAGVWLKADTIDEFRPLHAGVKQVNWIFNSDQLLVKWDAIITIQIFEGPNIDIGFKPTAE